MPREAYTRPKSVHSRGSGNMDRVHVRHPEFPNDAIDAHQEGITDVDLLGAPPEETIISVDSHCEPAADTACYLLDGFDRTVAAAARSNAAGSWAAGTKKRLLSQNVKDPYEEAGITQPLVYQNHPTTSPADLGYASSYIGPPSQGYYIGTDTPSWASCSGGKSTFVGWRHEETWWEFVVPVVPADMASITIAGFEIDPQRIYAWQSTNAFTIGDLIVVSSSEPNSIMSGTVVGVLNESNEPLTVQIDGALIPAEGEILYVGIIPGYTCDFGSYACGYSEWPKWNGQGNSGDSKVYFNGGAAVITWQTWDAAADVWGSILSDDENGSWWRGNLPWDISKTGGTLSMDGSSLKFVVGAGSTETLTAELKGDISADDSDDTEYGEPWSHPIGVNMKVRFKVTTAGSLTEAGLRSFYVEWHDGRDRIRGTVFLGDLLNAEGLAVATDDGTESLVKSVVNGSYMWLRIDARHGDFVRGKMWVEAGTIGGGEGAAFDVVVARADDSDLPTNDNYFRMVASIGNVTGADMTIQIERVLFCGPGEDCEWVTEKIGEGDGVISEYTTSQPYKKGTLWFFADGLHVRTVDIDRNNGEFTAIEVWPADLGINLIARYVVDLDTDDTT